MTVGGDTFINEVLSLSGFTNIYAHKSRYPIIEMQDIIEKQPDYIFLSSEPYPFKEKDLAAFQSLLPDSKIKVKLVDGEMFSWYGSHLLKASTYMQELKASLR
jgi:ABC-type Fe3+-hydroxamate transport system substrate-binding protein